MRASKNQAAPKPADTPLFPFWVEDRGLSSFLGLLVLIIIFVPMIRLSRPGRIGLDLVFAFMLFSGAVATIRQKILMYLVVALTVLEFTADLIVEFNSSLGPLGWDTAVKVAGLAILVVMTLRHTFRPGRVSVHRVMGGVAAYLLIGLTWAFGYKVLMDERPDAIHFQSTIAGRETGEPSHLIQFSFSTLTSVSYGDAYPVHRIARSLATAEALIGQLYPSILIAALVGMALQGRSGGSVDPLTQSVVARDVQDIRRTASSTLRTDYEGYIR
ncbi:MAG TPA: ion channel [Candidatus Acidoferrum sp.]|nr:ion channel [Candidatus Acidoferrum sp.]